MVGQTVFHPNMDLNEAIRTAKRVGCNVEKRHKTGEIVFTHPNIQTPYVMSERKESLGKAFLSWVKPALQSSEEEEMSQQYTLYEGSTQRDVAEAVIYVYGTDGVATTDNVCRFLMRHKYPLTKNVPQKTVRKRVSDAFSHLYSKGFVTRIDKGEYKPTNKLHKQIDISEKKDETAASTFTANLEATETPDEVSDGSKITDEEVRALDEEFSSISDIRISEEEYQELTEKEENIDNRIEALLDRFEHLMTRLEHLVNRLEISEEAKDIYYMFEELRKKKESGN